ncbi:Maf family protein [Methylomonas sp. MgM2]
MSDITVQSYRLLTFASNLQALDSEPIMKNLVLASGSQYRYEILKKLGLEFISHNCPIDENPMPNEAANNLALRLSIAKAQAAAAAFSNHLIIGSDQVAVCKDRLLGKPGDRDTAFAQLKTQSGRKVTFFTGVCVLDSHSGIHLTDIDICDVYFRKLSDAQILRYLEVDQPFHCAGSLKSEGYGISLINKINGEDPNALIGLPLIKLIKLLDQFGLKIP